MLGLDRFGRNNREVGEVKQSGDGLGKQLGGGCYALSDTVCGDRGLHAVVYEVQPDSILLGE